MEILNISEEQLNNLFSEDATPIITQTPPPNNDGNDNSNNNDDGKSKNTIPTSINTDNSSNIPHINLEELENEDGVGDDKDKNKSKDNTDTTKKPEDTTKDDKGDNKNVDTDEIKSALKSTINHLIEKGIWKDFDGRDELDIDSETYAQLAAQQEEVKINEMFSELLDSTGDYGKAIINHIKNGGNPDEIIDIFKEQKQTEAIDTKTDDGKIAIVQKYYNEVIGWKPEKISKFIKTLVEDNSLEAESTEIEEKYNTYYQAKLKEIEFAEEQKKIQAKESRDKFVNTFKETLNSFGDLTDKEKKTIEKAVTEYNVKLPNGQKVNEFYVKFAEFQNDPKKFVKLAQFIVDHENYEKKKDLNAETKASKKAFTFIKNGAALSNKSGVSTPEKEKEQKQTGTDISKLFKK